MLNKFFSVKLHAYLLLLTILSIGVFLRVNAAIRQSFWQDEVFIFTVARDNSPIDILLMNLDDKAHSQLYYLFIHYRQKIGTSVFFLRLPSIVAGTLTIILIFLIGKIVHGKTFGLASALAFAVNPFFVNLGFQAKFYPFVFLFIFAGLFCFLKTFDDDRKKWIFLSAIFNGMAFYTDYSSLWYFAAILITILISRTNLLRFLKISALTLIFISFGLIPLAFNLLDILHAESFLGEKSLVIVDMTLREFLGFYGYRNYIITYIFLYFFLASLINLAKRKSETKNHFFFLFILVGTIVPLLIAYTVSQWIPAFNGRNLWFSGLIAVFGLASLLTSVKRLTFPPALIIYSIIAVYLTVNLFTSYLRSYYFHGKTNWESIVDSANKDYLDDRKIFLFLDYEDPYWSRLMPFKDYYVQGYNNQRPVTNYRIVTVPIRKGLTEEARKEISLYSSYQAIWLFYSGEFLFPWSPDADEIKDHYRNIDEAKKILLCENKPCRQPVIIYD